MSVAYVDTSCVVAIAFGEAQAKSVLRRMQACEQLVSSGLLEAELLSAFARERRPLSDAVVSSISLISPDRSLRSEIERVLSTGHVRGADCWHLATALFLTPKPAELLFLTLDAAQRSVARSLGFRV